MEKIKIIINSLGFKIYKSIFLLIYILLVWLFLKFSSDVGSEPALYYFLFGIVPIIVLFIFYRLRKDIWLVKFTVWYDIIITSVLIAGLFLLPNLLAYVIMFPLIVSICIESIIWIVCLIKYGSKI